jgi:hypothetical protein
VKIQFYPSNKDVELLVPPPKPSGFYIPKWYKDIKKISEKTISLNESGRLDGVNIKSCLPFLDGMLNGYIQETWQDLAVSETNGTVSIGSNDFPEMVSSRGGDFHSPIGPTFYQNEFVWKSPWIPRLPKGWSALFIHPVNQIHLPFETATGMVDSDNFYHIPLGNLPFYIRKGFRGVIPKGTPMYQIIPIKRGPWVSDPRPWDEEEQKKRVFMIASKFHGAYRDLFHVKKEFK